MAAFASIALLLSSLHVVSSFTPHQYCSRRRVDIQQTRIDVACFQTSGDDSSSSDENDINYFHHLLSQFQGDFDNYHQVLRDRNHALTPAEGGGHEHIHCTLVPFPHPVVGTEQQSKQKDQWILAAFYFNGNPRQIFRFRMYKLISPHHDNDDNNMDGEKVRMKLHTLSSELEQQLRQYSDKPCTWWRESYNVWLTSTDEEENDWEKFQSEGIQRLVSPLVGCDVLWDPQWDPKMHAYLNVDEYEDDYTSSSTPKANIINNNHDDGCHATMEAGSKGAIVDSISTIPGKRILIKDELSLWENEFWINDRGYDPDTVVVDETEGNENGNDGVGNMPFVYGNRRGVPYKLERVSCISSSKDSNEVNEEMSSLQLLLERTITKQELAWTLGEEFRELTEYEEKLRAVEEALLKS